MQLADSDSGSKIASPSDIRRDAFVLSGFIDRLTRGALERLLHRR